MTDPIHDCATPGWTPDDLSPMFWRARWTALATALTGIGFAIVGPFLPTPWDDVAAGACVLLAAVAAYNLGRSRLLSRLAFERKPQPCIWHHNGMLPPELMPHDCTCDTPRYRVGGSRDDTKETQR